MPCNCISCRGSGHFNKSGDRWALGSPCPEDRRADGAVRAGALREQGKPWKLPGGPVRGGGQASAAPKSTPRGEKRSNKRKKSSSSSSSSTYVSSSGVRLHFGLAFQAFRGLACVVRAFCVSCVSAFLAIRFPKRYCFAFHSLASPDQATQLTCSPAPARPAQLSPAWPSLAQASPEQLIPTQPSSAQLSLA